MLTGQNYAQIWGRKGSTGDIFGKIGIRYQCIWTIILLSIPVCPIIWVGDMGVNYDRDNTPRGSKYGDCKGIIKGVTKEIAGVGGVEISTPIICPEDSGFE